MHQVHHYDYEPSQTIQRKPEQVDSSNFLDDDLLAHDEFGLSSVQINSKCQVKRKLKTIKDMPTYLQFNQYVHTGYRSVQDSWECLVSLTYLHNETVNIITHVLPIIGVGYFWKSMYPWDVIEDNVFFQFLGWSHIIASISPWIGSVAYHLFMNHYHGLMFYQLLLKIDMLGIWVTECFGALTNLVASTWCLHHNLQTLILIIYPLVSIWGLHMALTASSPLGRRMCFAPVFASRMLGFVLRVSGYGGEADVISHVVLQDVVSIAGGMIGVIRIPEKWFPGKLDMFFNSHHIMHVMVVAAVLHMNWATNGDILWILRNYDKETCY